MAEFRMFPKVKRATAFNPLEVTITEKIDGTNACIIVEGGEVIGAQSRKTLLAHNNTGQFTIHNDNMGFAHWVGVNKESLAALGDGHHYGEWAGPKVQSNPHNLTTKKFFLFNTHLWSEDRPPCCEVVSTLCKEAVYSEGLVTMSMSQLKENASEAGYKPEGIMLYFHAFDTYLKVTYNNPEGKWVT